MDAQVSLKMTRQRKVILEELRQMHTHPTADQLYEQVRAKLPHVSLATVYRNLDLLAKAGLINRLQTEGTQRRYDGDLQEHWHVRCIRCDCIDDVFKLPQKPNIKGARSARGFKILGHHLELLGICPGCR